MSTMTAAEHRTAAANADQAAADSFDRSDTDGFLSQWASGITADRHRAEAALADQGGKIDATALFLVDGTLASTHQGNGQYGPYWVLNDTAAATLGRRFVSTSSARKGARRHATDKGKGYTLGTVRVAGYVDTIGSGTGLSGAMSVRVVTRPDVKALIAGDFEVITTDAGPGADW